MVLHQFKQYRKLKSHQLCDKAWSLARSVCCAWIMGQTSCYFVCVCEGEGDVEASSPLHIAEAWFKELI